MVKLLPNFSIHHHDLSLACSCCEIILDHGLKIFPNLHRWNMRSLQDFIASKCLFFHACCCCEMHIHHRSILIKKLTIGICRSYGISWIEKLNYLVLVVVVKFISTVKLQPHQISIIEICSPYKISQGWKFDNFMHVGISKSTHAIDLEHHQISAIEIQGMYHISHTCSICFSLLVCLAKYLCIVDPLWSVHPTADPAWNSTFFRQYQILLDCASFLGEIICGLWFSALCI